MLSSSRDEGPDRATLLTQSFLVQIITVYKLFYIKKIYDISRLQKNVKYGNILIFFSFLKSRDVIYIFFYIEEFVNGNNLYGKRLCKQRSAIGPLVSTTTKSNSNRFFHFCIFFYLRKL